MAAPRLTLALEPGGPDLPQEARIAVFAPRAGMDLGPLAPRSCHVITGFRPDHDHFAALGYDCALGPQGRYDAALVCVPRARAQAQDLVAQAVAVSDGPVLVDGAKTDGIESMLKACRKRAEVQGPINKAHGKLFWFTAAPEAFADWRLPDHQQVEGGFVTAPGVFSADGIDPASRMLADHLPAELGAHVIDLGAGWGYLAARALERPGIARLDLVEADHAALDCARLNVDDERAQFHWQDALRWRPDARADCVIMNPPFHTERTADPGLGRAFIQAAAAMLKPSGHLWLVANRHLPYEQALAGAFGDVAEAAGDGRFKILHARRPARPRG